MALTTLAVVTAVAAVGTAYSTYKQGQEQKKAIRAEQRRADLQASRNRRQLIRNARVARASVESQASLTGLTGSSAAAGSMSNIQSRLGENLSFLDQNLALSQQASAANEAAARWASRAGISSAIGGMAKTARSLYTGPAPTPVGSTG